MDLILTAAEVRGLGSLIEKEKTTPEYYPLSLNALKNACNQKSSRDPVVSYDEQTVQQALDGLRDKKLAFVFYGAESRVAKYGHIFDKAFHLEASELSVLCVLMLRGAQTAGEIRQRSAPLHTFTDLSEVETAIEGLMKRDDQNLVVKLPRQTGMKESRYAHLLCGPISETEIAEMLRTDSPAAKMRGDSERIARLEEDTVGLRQRLDDLERQFTAFKKQFE